jgi:hypothetical protein
MLLMNAAWEDTVATAIARSLMCLNIVDIGTA